MAQAKARSTTQRYSLTTSSRMPCSAAALAAVGVALIDIGKLDARSGGLWPLMKLAAFVEMGTIPVQWSCQLNAPRKNAPSLAAAGPTCSGRS